MARILPTLAVVAMALPNVLVAADPYETAERAIPVFENLFGITEGKRRNHTKGFCFTGEFSVSGQQILNYSSSPIFRETSTVIGRVSHKGGNNDAADNKPGHYGLAFELTTNSGDVHIMNMNTEDFFPVPTAEEFLDLLRALTEGNEAVAHFASNSPEFRAYKAHHKNRGQELTSYEGATYNSVNSFYLVGDDGNRTAIRWSFTPSGAHSVLLAPKKDFFFENMQQNLSIGSVSWDMIVTIANADDNISDPSKPWTGPHQQINAARLTVKEVMSEADGECDDLNFDPLILSDGFAPSEDPMLQVRSAIYAIGASKRLSEK